MARACRLVLPIALSLTTGACVASDSGADAMEASLVTADVVYGHKDGMALTFDVLRPNVESNGAGILRMVSGGWISRWQPTEVSRSSYASLLDRGFTVFVVRHGSSPRYKVPEAAEDVELAVRYIRMHAGEFDVDETRLGVWGGSAGGHLSLMLGLDPDPGEPTAEDAVLRTPSGVAAVVAYFPPVDLREAAGPNERFPALDFDPSLAPSVSPLLFVSPDDPPTLLIHGDQDQLVPIRNSEVLHEALLAEGVEAEFVVISGADHGFRRPEDSVRATQLMVDWFDRHLVGTPTPR